METVKLTAKSRQTGKPNQIRLAGLVPVELYGVGKENVHLSVKDSDFIKVFRQAGQNTIVELDIDGQGTENVLIYEVTLDPVTDVFQHIDLIRVDMNKEVTASVPIEFIGQSKAVKDLGGILVENMNKFDITCLPADLPKDYKIDISSLETFDDAIYVRDLKIGKGMKIEADPDQVVVTVNPPRSDEELAELNKEVVEDVEGVETEVKKEVAEGEGAEGEGKDEKKE